ncbi:cysteine desulfurase family protein [Uliginosibacterium aquaticum]|uniref:cysteine desulfurase n=1 Tax=Uliginosibacterium aquaticum TaxID=2731212 RepID=A0ABX2IL69_9RHOO|nr:cysteine desulfurase family protein [Uliginosibacterium aquaticum]NSL54855.1 cysteine desulfurase [Uliginosibacterium aquaticum]
MIYLDNNATTRPLPEVVDAMTAALACWGNPSSKHALGEEAKRLLAGARAQVAALVDAQPVELIFTSGASESNHHALLGALRRPGAPQRVILSAIEHSGYLKSALQLRQQGVEVVLLDVDGAGRIRPESLQHALHEDAALVSVMAANNETGVLQPVETLAELARGRGVPVHVDATQMVGKLPLSFSRWHVDLVSFSAHKFHGPKGVGALLIRKGLSWPVLLGGQQERARRGGTENLPGIAGFAAAARHAMASQVAEAARLASLREGLESVLARIPGCVIHGRAARRLPNTTSLSIAGLSAEKILGELARAGICASSGAACSSGGSDPSHVLLAMGVEPALALGAVRLSLGSDTDAHQLSRLAEVLQSMCHSQPMPEAALG